MLLALRAWLGTQVRVGSANQVGLVNVYSKFGNNFLGVLKLKQGESRQAFSDRLAQRVATWMPFGTLPHKYLKVEMCSEFEDCKFESVEAGKVAYKAWVFWDVKSALERLLNVHPVNTTMYDCETRTLCLGMMFDTRVSPEVCVYSEATKLRLHRVYGQWVFPYDLDLSCLPCLQTLCLAHMQVTFVKRPPSLVALELERTTLLNAVPTTLRKATVINSNVDYMLLESLSTLCRLEVSHANMVVDSKYVSALAKMHLEALVFLDNVLDFQSNGWPDLVASICKLANLTHLRLDGNNLHGMIPTELGRLGLTDLFLANNHLTGTIPTELGCCLERLNLANNKLCGTIPSQLGRIVTLETLCLSNNRLCGSIPTELGLLVGLQRMWLEENKLRGNIPTQLGKLVTLNTLDLSLNRLCGSLPSELGLLSNLGVLALHCNRLSGIIPTELGLLTKLEDLLLQDNRLSGFPRQLVRLGFRADIVLR
jgi:Leucine-rich repeat (LRR) protein